MSRLFHERSALVQTPRRYAGWTGSRTPLFNKAAQFGVDMT